MKIYKDDDSRIKLFFELIDHKKVEELSIYSSIKNINPTGYYRILDTLTFSGIISYVSNPLNIPYESKINNQIKLLEEKYLIIFKLLTDTIKNKKQIKFPSSDIENKLHIRINVFLDEYYNLLENLNSYMNPNKNLKNVSKLDFNKVHTRQGVIFFDSKQITKPLGIQTQPYRLIYTFIKKKNTTLNLKLVFKEVFKKSKHSGETSLLNMKKALKGMDGFSKYYVESTPVRFSINYPNDMQISLKLVEGKK
jgi:hypothetical protein